MEAKHKTSEVFGISRDLPLNYVRRKSVDEEFIANLTRDKHIVVYGSSKQGKTSLRKNCLSDEDYVVIHCSNKWTIDELNTSILKKCGYVITQSMTKTEKGKYKILASLKASIFGIGADATTEAESETTNTVTNAPLEIDPSDVNDIISALIHFSKFIILEDFHYLQTETQKDFSIALKAFHEQSKLCFIIVGVWLEEGRLTVYNGDLTGRIHPINADAWTHEELNEVIEVGEALLNIGFDQKFKKELILASKGSVYVLQEACYKACEKEKIFFTQDTYKSINNNIDVAKLVNDVANQQTGRYNSFITQISSGFQETTLQMYKWMLYPVIVLESNTIEKGISYRKIKELLWEKHPEGRNLNPGNITQALQAIAALQVKKEIQPIVLDYDQTNLKLNVVDRGFIIWKENQVTADLLELAELPIS